MGSGLDWFTPENEYAPTTAEVEPAMVTTMFPVPVEFFKYQNSASLLEKEDTFFVSCAPANVMETTLLLFALTPTTSSWLLPLPALKFASVIWYGDVDTAPAVDWMLFSVIPVGGGEVALVVADAVLECELGPTEFFANTV